MKNLVITGASKGIGKEIAKRFVIEGFNVFFCSSKKENVEKTEIELKSLNSKVNIYSAVVDLSRKEEIIKFAGLVKQKFSSINILVNNAGVFIPGKISDEADGVFEHMMNLNLAAPYHLIRELMENIKLAEKAHVFNICSTASIKPYMNGGSYCISKFGLLGFSKVLREELKDKNVRVSSILPGATLTDSWAGTDLPEERFIPAESIADIVFYTYQLPKEAVVEEILIRPQLGDLG